MSYEFIMRQKPDSDEIITDDYLEHSLEDMLNNNEPKTFYLFSKSSDNRGGSVVRFSPNPLWGVNLYLYFGVLSSFKDKPARLYSFGNPSSYINSLQDLKAVIKREFETERKEEYRKASDKTVKNIFLHATLPDTEATKAATFVWTSFTDHVAKTKKNTSGNTNVNSGKHDIFSHSIDTLSHAQHEGYWSPNLGKAQTSAKPEFPWKLGKCYLKNYGGQIVMCAPLTTLNKKAHANYASIEFNLNAYGNDTAAKAIEDGARKFKQISGYTLPADMKPDLIRQAISLYYKYQDKPQHAGYYSPNLSHSYNIIYSGDELYHHGILGMKWGVRRYQNPDGSLTEAGRKRYGISEEKEKEIKNKVWSRDEEIMRESLQEHVKKVQNREYSSTEEKNAVYKDIISEYKNEYLKDIESDPDLSTLQAIIKMSKDKADMKKWYESIANERVVDIVTEESEKLAKPYSEKIEKADLLSYTNMNSPEYKNRASEAAELGIKALNKIWNYGYDPKDEGYKDWFLWEDQTIGLATLADLVRRGKTKKDIYELLQASDRVRQTSYEEMPGVFELHENSNFRTGDSDDYTNEFIDTCIEILKEDKK